MLDIAHALHYSESWGNDPQDGGGAAAAPRSRNRIEPRHAIAPQQAPAVPSPARRPGAAGGWMVLVTRPSGGMGLPTAHRLERYFTPTGYGDRIGPA